MDSTINAFWLAWRMIARRPGLAFGRAMTVTVVVTAATAVFTVANATFIRPLPFPDADRLVRVYLQPPGTTDFNDANPLQPHAFFRFRDSARMVERLEGIWVEERAVTGEGEPESVRAGLVSAGFIPMLGGRPTIGRVFNDAEVEAGAKLVVLSHGFWIRRFGGARDAIGNTLQIDREPYTIIGVVQPGFEPGFAPSEVWTPLSIRRASIRMTATFVQTIALLKPGVSTAEASGELAGLLHSVRAEVPMLNAWTVGVVGLRQAEFGSRRPAIVILLTTVLALLLIATGNLANLTLADVMSRRTDFSVRAALGASRRNLATPAIAESLLIACAGACAGLASAAWLVPALLALDPSSTLNADQLTTDWRVVGCGVAVATVVMIAAGVAPVFRFTGPGLALDVSTGGQRAIGGVAASRTRTVLVIAQTALALVLLSSGALVVTTFQRTTRTNPGFDPANVVTAQLRLPEHLFPTEVDRANFVDRMLEHLRATPGVVNAGTTLNRFDAAGGFQTLVHIENRPTPDGQPHTVQFRRVSPGYFETLRVALIAGRLFERRDWVGAQPVALVSRGFARRFWGTDFVVGCRLRRGTAPDWIPIIGVVDDVRDLGLERAPIATVYTPYYQASNPAAPVALVVRTKSDPRATLSAIKKAVWEVDAKQPLANITTFDEFFGTTLGPQRFRAALVTICGAIGLLLATIGTYGITARSVVERTREIGIRLALGGRPLAVWWATCWSSLRAVIAGAAAGALVSRVATAVLGMMLPELEGSTWEFTAAAAFALLLVGGVAALVAARTATSVEPLRALRGD